MFSRAVLLWCVKSCSFQSNFIYNKKILISSSKKLLIISLYKFNYISNCYLNNINKPLQNIIIFFFGFVYLGGSFLLKYNKNAKSTYRHYNCLIRIKSNITHLNGFVAGFLLPIRRDIKYLTLKTEHNL